MQSFRKLLDGADAFHDMCLRCCSFDGHVLRLGIGDHSLVAKSADLSDAPIVARVLAKGVFGFDMWLDMATSCAIREVVEAEPGKLDIYLDNGGIFIEADDIDIEFIG